MSSQLLALEVWGDYALFTRPETKVERLSYPIITPSAARSIFDSIYIGFESNPTPTTFFRWQIRRIEICNPVIFIGYSRNEVKGKINANLVDRAIKTGEPLEVLEVDGAGSGHELSGRTQRQSMILKDVRYRIFAEPILFSEDQRQLQKIYSIFTRRASQGQCFHQPSLGCREFGAFFRLITPQFGQGIASSFEIGWMVYDVFDLSKPNHPDVPASVSIFRASIEHGVLEVPPYQSDEVRKLGIGVI